MLVVLINILSVYIVVSVVVRYMIDLNLDLKSVLFVVMECNDFYLNNIRKMVVKEDYYFEVVKNVLFDFEEGVVGVGIGMSVFEFKGGIGFFLRVVEIGGEEYKVVLLVLVNFGRREDLMIVGVFVGEFLKDYFGRGILGKGSILMVVVIDVLFMVR